MPERISPQEDLFLMRLASRYTDSDLGPPGGSILASGEEVDITNVTAIQSVLNRRQRWQYQALDAHEACGELNYGVSQLSGAISRLRIYVADKPSSADSLPEATTNSDAAEVIDQLGNIIDRAELQRRMSEQLFITGEPYMIYRAEKEAWEIRSIEEVIPSGKSVQLRDAPNDDKGVTLSAAAGDTWIRLLHQSARWASQATSHVKPILDDVDELAWWSAAARAHARNQLAMNGILMIPQSLESPVESEEDAQFSGSERWLRKLYNRGITTIKNPSSAAGSLPMMGTYPDNDNRKSGVEFIDMKRASSDLITQRTTDALKRIAQGINLPPEVITGVSSGGSGASHFTMQAITESLFIQHVEPPTLILLHALTTAWLRPILKKMGLPPNDFLLWYDSSNLIAKPDMSQAADFGVQNILINGKAWRRTRNFSEDDAPTDEEAAKMIGILQVTRGRIPPGGGQDGSVNPSDTQPLDPNNPQKTVVPSEHPPKPQPAVTSRGKGQDAITKPIAASANGHKTDADVLLAQLQVLGDMCVRRALERSGNVLRSRAQKNANYKSVVKSCASEEVARTLGREACTKLGIDDLFDNCFDTAAAQFRTLVASVTDEPMKDPSMEFVKGLRLVAAEKLFSPPDLQPVITREFVEGCFVTKEV